VAGRAGRRRRWKRQMTSRTVTVDVDVDVDVEDFDDEDLVDELRHRGYSVVKKDRREFSWLKQSYE
jgi:hypothetical protein